MDREDSVDWETFRKAFLLQREREKEELISEADAIEAAKMELLRKQANLAIEQLRHLAGTLQFPNFQEMIADAERFAIESTYAEAIALEERERTYSKFSCFHKECNLHKIYVACNEHEFERLHGESDFLETY